MKRRHNATAGPRRSSEVRISIQQGTRWTPDRRFSERLCVGRDDTCDIQLDTSVVSREHAEVVFEGGRWRLRDLGSTNGTFVAGQRIRDISLQGETLVNFGKDGPSIKITVVEDEAAPENSIPPANGSVDLLSRTSPQNFDWSPESPAEPVRPPQPSAAGNQDVDDYIQRYFADTDAPAGEHTMMIRRAYTAVQQKQKRRYTGVIAVIGVLLLCISGYAVYRDIQLSRQEAQAAEIFYAIKEQDLRFAQQRQALLDEPNAERLIRSLNQTRDNTIQERYDGYVREFGVRRKLTEEEQLIYQVARQFNEFEMEMPAEFVRAVRDTIEGFWMQPGQKMRFEAAVRRAEREGYTPYIVETMQFYGLPPQYFYLAMIESDFKTDVSGWLTNFGYAKGMWQFIPTTGERYGLSIGPLAKEKVYDPDDERHDFQKSTDAAARYLLDIYSTLAQASGLLVMASYNWGEHRVGPKLEQMFEGIPENARERNYWKFLDKYENRMPDETKNYVIKIFSAAVIGQDPEFFGLNIENPLLPYLEDPVQP